MTCSDAALLFDLGQCQRLLGKNDKALFYYQRYLKERPDATNRDEVKALIAQMQLAPGPMLPGQLAPPHKWPGLLELEAISTPVSTVPSTTEKVLSWGTIGLGVVLLSVGLVLGVQADNAADQANACDPWRPECDDAIDRRDDLAPWSYALGGLGAATVLGGGLWTGWLYYGREHQP